MSGKIDIRAIIDAQIAGGSFAVIAAAHGVTRATIAGILFRARERGEIIGKRAHVVPARRVREKARSAPPPQPAVPYFPAPVSLFELQAEHCRWPLWGNDAPISEKLYCGLTALPGQSYCAHCAGLSYNPQHTRDMDRRLGVRAAR